MGKKFCPECESEEVMLVAGGITGGWMCKECGHVGIFPEKLEKDSEHDEIDVELIEEVKDAIKEHKKKGRKK